ncbi:MAG TPA: trypsin-like peptidase domain-containing protein [Kofleriaceae bacterium]|nr:trypsin-like peptidase domain-containing protein [Kofleriaceae bacterium]
MSYSSVVRIYATTQDPDHDSPWQAQVPQSSTGSGVVIGPGRVLTGAHVVANATFVQVQKISAPDKAVARVIGVCHDCDLALLSVEDRHFMEGIEPARMGELPDLRDRVAVVGFPVGGEEISITEGVVSRIEVQRYSHSQRHLLAVTVDAAINKGNSGGPVFKSGQVVGIAFQKLENAENVGEMVPAPIINHFLAEVDRHPGREVRIPALGITTQGLENPFLRRRLGLEEGEGGVLILSLDHGGSAWGVLEPGDALLEIAGHRIAANSTVKFRGRYRTRYDVMLGWCSVGDELELVILRGGKRRRVKVVLAPPAPLVPRNQYDRAPTYFIYGGLVFQVLSRDYLATWDSWWDKAPKEFLHLYYSGSRTPERHEVVILTQILADEINVGYEGLYSESVVAVNGRMPRDIADFVRMVEASRGMLEIRTSSDSFIVLDAERARAANPRILERYRIARDRSPDLDGLRPTGSPARELTTGDGQPAAAPTAAAAPATAAAESLSPELASAPASRD